MSNQLPESLDFRKEQPHLLTSIEERLRGEELYPEETAEDAARRTQWERLQMMAKIPNNLQGMQIIGKELASYKNDPEAYGHLVLDSLENTLQPNDHGSTAQQEKLEQQLENGWDDVQSHEQRWKVMDQIQHDRAFELPQTEDQIRRSRYFYMDPTGIVRVETDIIERDLRALRGQGATPLLPFQGKQSETARQTLITQLEALQRADPARNFVTQEKRRLRERTVHPKVQAARDALKAIGGLLFAGLGLLSAIGERHKMMNGEIPWTTALYGGLLLAVWNPQAFHGPERHMAETFSFIKTDTWNTLVQNNRSHLTDDFFWQMTDSKVRALSATIAKTDHANTLQYYDQLKGRVDDPSIAFLQKLEKEHPDQWKILLASTARIATQDERGALQHLVQNNALNTEALVLPS